MKGYFSLFIFLPQIYLTWNLFTFETQYEDFCLVCFSWSYYFSLLPGFYLCILMIYICPEILAASYIFKSKKKKICAVISIFLKDLFYSNTLRILILLNTEIIYTQQHNIFTLQICLCFLLKYHFSSIYCRDDNNVMISLKYGLIFSENTLTWKPKKPKLFSIWW